MRQRGFTLLEVLVALGIFAVVAASVLTLSERSLKNATRLEEKTFSLWVADNLVAELKLPEAHTEVGQSQGVTEFAGRSWQWVRQIEASSEPLMRRVTVWVGLADPQDQALAVLYAVVEAKP